MTVKKNKKEKLGLVDENSAFDGATARELAIEQKVRAVLTEDKTEDTWQRIQARWDKAAREGDEISAIQAQNESIVISLQEWKEKHVNQTQQMHATIHLYNESAEKNIFRAASLDGSSAALDGEEHQVYGGLSQASSYRGSVPVFKIGDELQLNVWCDSEEPLFYTALLKRGRELIRLVNPYSREDEDIYTPTHGLELPWIAEDGPKNRAFIILCSKEPLVEIQQIPETSDGETWLPKEGLKAILSIDMDKVVRVHEVHWEIE